ncbi:hypothetical protein AC792_02300 [Arthrobacter sp. RIT-PI-e]|uniref:class I SAM-dependent methyltransferase n=1 Tax=Arthrobacter sp. RIT-PI-e TaxID=1681197 RepID=UPI000676725F|nr:class I SAM-dependent methyltransferase [Arthrobacter sp. RIT-PI-e]KNC20129.1 hypothetical protein AC792_02300 [Arthrobacter sp. RIT-PI-e]
MSSKIQKAYSHRAAEYTELLGSIESVHPADRLLVTGCAERLSGPVIDAGCGPGHWTAFLAEHRVPVSGVDLVPAFVDHARAEYPGIAFDVGSIDALVEGEHVCVEERQPPERPGHRPWNGAHSSAVKRSDIQFSRVASAAPSASP